MNRSILVFLSLIVMAASSLNAEDTRLFELRIYHCNPGKLEALHDRFRDHTLALFEKHGMEHIGYWTPTDAEDTLVYLIAFASEEAQSAAWKQFVDDPDWQAAYQASIRDGKLVKEIDSVLMRLTDYSPAIKIAAADPNRLFEMRTYTASEGNLGNLDARFRDHTVGLFEAFGIENLYYFHLVEGQEGAENTLLYFIAHKDQASRDANFTAFGSSDAWKTVRAESEKNAGGSLTVEGGVKSQFLAPTDYSLSK